MTLFVFLGRGVPIGALWHATGTNGDAAGARSRKSMINGATGGDTGDTQTVVPDGRLAIDDRHAHLRWFVLPIEETSSVTKDHDPLELAPPIGEDENEEEEEERCQPDASGDAPDVQSPLDPTDRGKGSLGDFGTDEEPDDAKALEDWDRHVVVRRKELSKAEETKLPWCSPPLDMYRRVSEAIHGLEMIKEGDKVLVCLSGGKDSLSLLHILHFYQMRCRKNKSTNFDLGAITVDPGSTAYNPRPLMDYCRSLNIDYFYEEQDIIGAAKKLDNVRSICAFCSRMKRGRLAAAAQLHGWNVLAMGQHLDDVAERVKRVRFRSETSQIFDTSELGRLVASASWNEK
ncbi:unnamed protein product [Heligmosomoides polygyrus]|uniref:ATP_bind_3 domain-containing protein n=1 Tax=Heligmosomoides polygyrus TaxID=6339 RepID=A0A3P7XXQ5_HELPZ|nr:unnamed protein product [Heligmosomoides polygyrus]